MVVVVGLNISNGSGGRFTVFDCGLYTCDSDSDDDGDDGDDGDGRSLW